MDLDRLISDLKILKASIARSEVASMNERVRTYQQIGGFILRHERLDAIIDALEKVSAERA